MYVNDQTPNQIVLVFRLRERKKKNNKIQLNAVYKRHIYYIKTWRG